MKTQDKELLIKDLCGRLLYGVKVQMNRVGEWDGETKRFVVSKELTFDDVKSFAENGVVLSIKPYLRPMSNMTKEEAKTLVTLWGIEDFISLDITEEYIGVVCDDGFGSTVTTEIWYDGDMSIECYDFLNSRHLDYRGLIPVGLALPALEGMYNFK